MKKFWENYGGTVGLVGFVFGVMAIVCGIWYASSHTVVKLDDDINVQVSGGRVWYNEYIKETGHHNQFFASNELGFSDMTMSPSFRIVNVGTTARDVSIHSLEAWQVPISGKIHLEPGQEFEFEFKARFKHWYCWIRPIEVKKTDKEI